MDRITIVIEGATDHVRLGMPLAGGRVVSASLGDLIEPSELTGLTVKQLEAGVMALARYIGPKCVISVIEAIQEKRSG